LRNLDVESAFYDPKTRSMRENPYENKKNEIDSVFVGDNFVRWTGDGVEMLKSQSFVWQAYDKGVDINLQADPTRAELLRKEFSQKKTEKAGKIKKNIIEKYGGEEHLNSPPEELVEKK
jgi:pre-mRNA-processing factor SLU7